MAVSFCTLGIRNGGATEVKGVEQSRSPEPFFLPGQPTPFGRRVWRRGLHLVFWRNRAARHFSAERAEMA